MPLRIDETITAVASCSYCRWQAQHRGPAIEVSVFLRGLVLQHVHDRHADVMARDGGRFEILDRVGADIADTLRAQAVASAKAES